MCSEAGKKGKEVLQDFVQNAKLKVEYVALTEEEKRVLIAELEQVKATKAKGFRPSARSRINDITKTMAILENEVNPSYFVFYLLTKFRLTIYGVAVELRRCYLLPVVQWTHHSMGLPL